MAWRNCNMDPPVAVLWTLLFLLILQDSATEDQGHHKFTVRWNNPSNGYFPLPWSLREAGMGTVWRRAGHDHALNVLMVSHIEDPRFILLFDKQNTIAGVTFGFDHRDVNRVMAPDSSHNYTFPDAMFYSDTIWDKDMWLTTVLFDDPEKIRTNGRPELNHETDDVISELHYKADYDWRRAPLSEQEARALTDELVEQGCYNGMGRHYFYRTDPDTDCASWQGFFVTYDQGRLAGFGVAVFGSFVTNYFTPTYYEYPAFPVVKTMLPHRPACVDEWLPYTGVTSVHVYVVADAANISCEQQPAVESADQSVTSPWYERYWPQWEWLHPHKSRAPLDAEPSYLTTVILSAAIILYYFSFCF